MTTYLVFEFVDGAYHPVGTEEAPSWQAAIAQAVTDDLKLGVENEHWACPAANFRGLKQKAKIATDKEELRVPGTKPKRRRAEPSVPSDSQGFPLAEPAGVAEGVGVDPSEPGAPGNDDDRLATM